MSESRWLGLHCDPLLQVPKLNGVKAKIRVDLINADAMKQKGWVAEATLLFVHTNFSAKDIIEIRTKADGMKVSTAKRTSGSCPAILCAERYASTSEFGRKNDVSR